MGERSDESREVAELPAAPEGKALPAASAEDATVAGADPFASTLTVPLASAVPFGPQLEAGHEVWPVRLVREIGRGATGAVFQGHHTVLGRDVAVKFLIHVPAGRSGEEGEGIKRFVDEARAAASVRHPNLTQIFHADVDGGTPYLVLEYVRGPTLRQLLEHAGHLDATVTAAVMTDVAAAVAELHARGIIHRDIKPSNALVDADGRVCVTDFGLAVRRSQPTAVAGASPDIDFAGTPAYMAPEMFEGRISARSDVYAMGVMAFQLLSGTTPFSGAFHELREKHAHEPLPSQSLRGRGVGPEVVDVIERATHKQAMFRYKGAPDFARALREAAGLGAPEMSRARKQLCDLVAGRAVTTAESGAEGANSTGEVRGPRREPAEDSDSTLYTQTISRIATSKRERRRIPAGDSEGSSVTPPAADRNAAAEPPPDNGGTSAVPSASQASPGPSPAVAGAPTPALPSNDAEKLIPPPVLFVGVSGIIYGSLVALWVIGLLSGRGNLSPDLPPPKGQGIPVVAVLVVAAVLYFFLQVALVAISAACLRLRALARRLMIVYALTDLALQVGVLVLGLSWVEPARVRALAAGAGAGAPTAVIWTWIVQWMLLSIFPLVAVYVMRRRDVRATFEAAAAAPRPDEDFPQPAF